MDDIETLKKLAAEKLESGKRWSNPIRTSRLEPKLDPKSKHKPWRLSVPANRSRTGRRQNLYFATKDEASNEAALIERQNRTHGQLIRDIPPHDLFECAKALDLLRPTGVGLLECVTSFLGDFQRRQVSPTFGAVWDAYESAAERSRRHIATVRQTRALVDPLIEKHVCDLTAADLAAAFARCAPATADKRVSVVRAVLNFALRKTWVQTNVAVQLDRRAQPVRDEVAVFTPDEVRRLLSYSLDHDRDLLPYFAICFFCGIRPEREAALLTWDAVHLDGEPEVVVSAELSKTRQRRFVPISANCVEWLRASGSTMSGRVAPFSDSVIARRRGAMCKATGVRWIKDGARHTFCSAWLSTHKNVDRLREICGHTDTATLFRHYNRSMPGSQAEEFWSLVP
jgi:integrase